VKIKRARLIYSKLQTENRIFPVLSDSNSNYQEEIDDYWSILTSNGGEESRCGWLKDQFGISWQLVPTQLDEWMSKSPKVMEELMKMNKPDLNILRKAAETVNQ